MKVRAERDVCAVLQFLVLFPVFGKRVFHQNVERLKLFQQTLHVLDVLKTSHAVQNQVQIWGNRGDGLDARQGVVLFGHFHFQAFETLFYGLLGDGRGIRGCRKSHPVIDENAILTLAAEQPPDWFADDLAYQIEHGDIP